MSYPVQKMSYLAAITVPLGAHLALSGAWSTQALSLVALQTTSAICFMAAGNTFNDIADVSIDKKAKPNKPIPAERITIEQATKLRMHFLFKCNIHGSWSILLR